MLCPCMSLFDHFNRKFMTVISLFTHQISLITYQIPQLNFQPHKYDFSSINASQQLLRHFLQLKSVDL